MTDTNQPQTMPVQLQMDSQAINNWVAQMILQSALGTKIKQGVEQLLSGRDWRNDPIEAAVKYEVHNIARKYVEENFKAKIEEAVKTALTPERLQELTNKMIDRIVERIASDSY